MNRNKLLEEALKIRVRLEKDKLLYRRLDDITQLLSSGKKRTYLFEGYRISVIDNFAEKNTVFRATAIRRFELAFEKRRHRRNR
jgi:hypothetical protein